MDTRPCSFCSHENPEDAKFCNACGSSMHLQLCQHCGAIDNAAATACYKCGASLSGQGSDEDARPGHERAGASTRADAIPTNSTASANAAPAARAADPSPVHRREQRKGGGARALLFVVIAAAAALLYRAYTPSEEGDAADPEQVRAAGPSSPGTIDATLGAVPPSSAIVAAEVVPVRTPLPLPDGTPPPTADDPPLPVAETPPAAGREAPAATAADGSQAPPRSYSCTPEVAALGLCN